MTAHTSQTPRIIVADLLEITLPNWKKFNPRPDRANFTWFRMENNFFNDQSVFYLSCNQKILYLFVLCEASKKNAGEVKLRVSYTSAILQMPPEQVRDDFFFIAELGLFAIQELDSPHPNPHARGVLPSSRRHNDGMEPSNSLATNEQDERDERTNKRESGKLLESPVGLPPLALLWNQYAHPDLPKVDRMGKNTTRYRRCLKMWAEHPDEEFWKDVFNRINKSAFLTGSKGFKADLQFLCRPDTLDLLLEGKYDQDFTDRTKPLTRAQIIQRNNEDLFRMELAQAIGEKDESVGG